MNAVCGSAHFYKKAAILVLLCFTACTTVTRTATTTIFVVPNGTPSPASSTTPTTLSIPATAVPIDQCPAPVPILQVINLNIPQGVPLRARARFLTPPTSTLEVAEYLVCFDNFSVDSKQPLWQQIGNAINISRWASGSTFPFDGEHQQTCSATQHCYATGVNLFLLLDDTSVTRTQQLAFRLLVAMPQPVTPCDPLLFPYGNYVDALSPLGSATFPLPPYTQVSSGNGQTGDGILQYLCSAGTAQSLSDFMQSALPKNGWKYAPVGNVMNWESTTAAIPVRLRLDPIKDPHLWQVVVYLR